MNSPKNAHNIAQADKELFANMQEGFIYNEK